MLSSHAPIHLHKGIPLAALLVLAAGCGGRTGLLSAGGGGRNALGGSGGSHDAGLGGRPDAGDTRIAPDVAAGKETGAESGQEAGSEAGRDVGRESGPDAGLEVGRETGPDARPDATSDARSDARSDAMSDAMADAMANADTPPRVPMLKLVAGGVGGPGDADGIGKAARFYTPKGLYYDGAGSLYLTDKFNNTIRKIVIATATVTTVAGSPLLIGGDDGVGAAARFNRPSGIVGDGAGNLFVADELNHTIRKIVLGTGAVTTLAGSPGAKGSLGGTGTDARFYQPTSLAMDDNGDLFVADSHNFTIRKIDVATSVVTTLAGSARQSGQDDGVGAAARFGYMASMTSDGAGNLFVAESGNYGIRKVATATGVVSTIAKQDRYWFSQPEGLTFDGAGNLYFSDTENQRIRQLDLDTESVTTLAGSTAGSEDGTGEQARFDDPAGIVYDGAGNLYVADQNNNTIRKIVIATGVVTTLAGMPSREGSGSTEELVEPRGIASDGAGNLLVADRINCVIRKVVVATGEVTTFAGSPRHCGVADGIGAEASFLPLHGMVNDGAGNLFVADYATVRKVVLATSAVTTLAGSKDHGHADGIGKAARFYNLGGVAHDGAGNLFLADTNNHAIRKVVIATGEVGTLAGMPQAAGSSDGTASSARFNYPEGIVYDGAGDLLVADTDNHTLRTVVIATGAVTTFAGEPGKSGSIDGLGATARFNRPKGLAIDAAGDLFVADGENRTVRKIAMATGAVTTLVGTPGQMGFVSGPLPASLGCPSGLLVESTGDLFITDDCEHSVLVVDF